MAFVVKKYYWLFLCGFFFSFCAYGQQSLCDSLAGKTFAQRSVPLLHFFEKICDTPAHVMKSTLFGLEHCAKQKHDIELAMQFRLMRYRAYFIHHMPVPHLEDSITYFLDEIDKSGNLLLKADVLQELSDYYTFELQETGTGFGYMLKAYNIYKNIPASEFPQKYFCLYRLAGIYYRFQDYEQAKRLCMEAKSIPRYVIPDFFNVLNLMGMCYRNMGIYDSAVACFKEAYYGADSMHKTAWMGILSGNIGITYYY